MKRREIPKKNYLIMGFIVVITICLTFYLALWYKTIKDYKQNNSVIVEILSQIEEESISSYLLDNPTTVMYLASSNNQEIKSFERKFKKYIVDNDLRNEIVYFDTIGLESEYINGLLVNYAGPSLKKLKNIVVPNLIFFENGVIVDILYVKEFNITKNDMINFLQRNNVITND